MNPNGSNTDYWFEYGPTTSLGRTAGSGFWDNLFDSLGSGNNSVNVSEAVRDLAPDTTYYFRVVARNRYGTAYGNILSFRTETDGGGQLGAPFANTNAASGITQTSAVMNGTVNANGSDTTAWFEYGRTVSLGQTVGLRSVGSANATIPVSQQITNLQLGTIYYYRVVARNPYGTAYGNVIAFRTQNGAVYTPPPPSKPPVGGSALVTVSANIQSGGLVPNISNLTPKPGEILTYSVTYRNQGPGSATNAVLRIILPAEVDYLGSNPNTATVSGNLLTFQIGTIRANQEGTVTVTIRVRDNVPHGTNLNFLAVMDYLDPSGRPQSVSAPLTIQVQDPNGIVATISETGGFLPWYIWVIIITLFLVMLALSYVFYRYGRSRRVLAV